MESNVFRWLSVNDYTRLITLHYATLHYMTLQSTTLRYTTYNYNQKYNSTTLHYTHYANYTTLHHSPLRHTTLTFPPTPLNYTTLLQYTTPTTTTTTTATIMALYATLHLTTSHYPAVQYARPTIPLQYNCKYTTRITLHHNYNSTTLQLPLQLNYTTLHPAVVGEATTETIASIWGFPYMRVPKMVGL